MKVSQISILFLAIIFITSCKAVERFVLSEQSHLPDAELIENLKTHRAEFEKLVVMISEDKNLKRVDSDWTDPKDFSPERTAEYRKLFRVAGIPRGFYAGHENSQVQIRFLASSQGFVTHGSSKGYIYGDECSDGKMLESLDQISSAERPYGSGCRHIEGKWYLYSLKHAGQNLALSVQDFQ